MAVPVYPVLTSDDPNPASWSPGIEEDPTLRSKKMSGLATARARFTRVSRSWAYEYTMLCQADKEALELFERNQVNYGAVSFYWINFQEAYGADARRANTTYQAGQIVQPVSPNGRSYRCTTGGATHMSATPSWPTTVNGTVTDGTVVWTENTYRVRFVAPIQFKIGLRIDLWVANVAVIEV